MNAILYMYKLPQLLTLQQLHKIIQSQHADSVVEAMPNSVPIFALTPRLLELAPFKMVIMTILQLTVIGTMVLANNTFIRQVS